LTVEEIAEVREWIKSVQSPWEDIDFDKEKNPKCLRRQRLLWKNYRQSKTEPFTARLLTKDELARRKPLPLCLARLFESFLAWHGLKTLFVLKLLRAYAGCNYQSTHCDCPEMRNAGLVTAAAAQFEGMIALEPDTNRTALVVGSTEHIIPQGCLHVWKGTHIQVRPILMTTIGCLCVLGRFVFLCHCLWVSLIAIVIARVHEIE
jgi:hypothetical protein